MQEKTEKGQTIERSSYHFAPFLLLQVLFRLLTCLSETPSTFSTEYVLGFTMIHHDSPKNLIPSRTGSTSPAFATTQL
jgi:hypothetical protein